MLRPSRPLGLIRLSSYNPDERTPHAEQTDCPSERSRGRVSRPSYWLFRWLFGRLFLYVDSNGQSAMTKRKHDPSVVMQRAIWAGLTMKYQAAVAEVLNLAAETAGIKAELQRAKELCNRLERAAA